MATLLSAKLRAARQAAKMTQAQVADQIGVTRGAITQWESKDPENRTNPSIEHVRKYADITGVPFTWLIDDHFKVSDVYHARDLHRENKWQEVNSIELHETETGDPVNIETATFIEPFQSLIVSGGSGPFAPGKSRSMAESFWMAVQFYYSRDDDNLLEDFDVSLRLADQPIKASFLKDNVLIRLEAYPSRDAKYDVSRPWVRRAVSEMLLAEKAVGRPMRKYIFAWISTSEDPNTSTIDFAKAADVELLYFREPQPAAEALEQLVKR